MPARPEAGLASPLGPAPALVLHLFAHVPLDDPADLSEPRWCEWIAPRVGRTSERREEAEALAARWPLVAQASSLQLLPLLCADLRQLQRAALRPFSQLEAAAVADPEVLRALQRLDVPLLELLWVSLGLELEGWLRAWPELEAALQASSRECEPALAQLATWVPELRRLPLALAPSLGPRGRAFPEQIVVGAPLEWSALTPRDAALQAAHEALVHAAQAEWSAAEPRALRGLAAALAEAPSEWRAAHAAWLGRLDLRGVAEQAPELAPLLALPPERRADALRELKG